MKNLPLVLSLLLFFICEISFSMDFKYDQKVGRKFRFKNQVIFSIYQNNNFVGTDDQMNKVILELTGVTNSIGIYDGKYFNYSRKEAEDTYKLTTVYSNTFSQDDRGKMYVTPQDTIPSTRSIPTFPSKPVETNESWNAKGEEVIENVFESGKAYKVPVDVSYRYLSNVTVKNKELAVISVDYGIINNPADSTALANITGKSHNIFYWDIENSAPYFYSEEINLLYTAKSGETMLYKGYSASQVDEITDVTNTDKTSLMQEISNQVASPTNGVNVRETNDGIIVDLGNILFEIDSYQVKKDYEDKLDDLALVLNQHPALDIVVSGHTDNTGSSPYNTTLSENRAKAITDYLVSKGIAKSRISYIGYGPTKPIADNSTPAGRAQNRRVEVKIITKE